MPLHPTRHRFCSLPHGAALPALCLALAVWAPRAQAVDVWTQPNPGVRHLHRTTPAPAEFHALVVDLTVAGVSIRCTPPNDRWRTTSVFARESHPPLAAAINGGFWGLFGQGAQGLAAGGGHIWSSDDEELGFFAYGRDGRAWVSRPSDVVEAGRRGVTDAVSGRPMIVDRARLGDELAAFARTYTREPRTAVGVSQDGHTVYLVTVDGRRTTSRGGTLVEVAELMIELGAYRALNLDGGGSTTMFVGSEGGVVNRPSRGWEREVVNHIGVIAPAPPPVAANVVASAPVVSETPRAVVDRALAARTQPERDPGDEDEDGTGVRGWFRRHFGRYMVIDRFALGRKREVVVPALFLCAVLVVVLTASYVVRKLLRWRAVPKALPRGPQRPQRKTPLKA